MAKARHELPAKGDLAVASKRGKPVVRRPLVPGALSYRVPHAADILGVSEATVWRMIAAGVLEARKIGARTVIRAEVLKDYLEGTPLVTKAAQ